MELNIKDAVEKIIPMITKDEKVKEQFSKDPVGAVRGIVGDAADNDTVKKIVEAIKAALADGKLDMKDISSIGEKITGALGGLFGGKKDE